MVPPIAVTRLMNKSAATSPMEVLMLSALASSMNTKPSRCPAGFPLTSPKTATSKMMLVGGCMIATDAQYRRARSIADSSLARLSAPPSTTERDVFPGQGDDSPRSSARRDEER